jgi:dipeptidyl aminopeptidase/acylaminoacyl peptidase
VCAAVAWGGWCRATAASVTAAYSYPSSVSSDVDGPLDLVAELTYDDSREHAPIAVVMHGYSGASGKLGEVRGNAQYLRDKGFFAVSVAMRGRDGSDGVRDSGGLEIYDIYDGHLARICGCFVD